MRRNTREFAHNQRVRFWMKRRRRNLPNNRTLPSVDEEREQIRILRKLDEFRKTDLFCDGLVVAPDGTKYRVHRVLMAAKSDYFRAAFSSPLSSDSTIVKLDFPSSIVDSIVNFCYTGSCDINSDNVQQVLPAADQVGIVGLVELCCKFLTENMSLANVYGIHRFATVYSCDSLALSAWSMMAIKFTAFLKESREFSEMRVEDLELLLNYTYLNVPSESVAFEAMSQWINVDLEGRAKHVNRLWSVIRFGLMSPEYYRTRVLIAPFIDSVSSSNLWRALNAVKNVEVSEMKSCTPRVPHQIVFAIGGWTTGAPTKCVETYDIRADRWFRTNLIDSVPRAYHGLVAVDNLIYLIGGFDGTDHFSSVRCFDPVTETWTEKASMDRQRCYVSCVVVDKEIYAIGGFNGSNRMNSVERYNVVDNQWRFVRPMMRRRSDCGAVAVGTKIYVAGGFNGQEVLNSAEFYDAATDAWTTLPNLNARRSGVCLALYDGYIYAIGGFNGGARLNSVERLNVSRPYEWLMDVPNMISQRSNFCSVVIEDRIFVMGGFNGLSTIPNCECFDGEQWYEISSMNQNRSALSACICEGLKNAIDYTYGGRMVPNNRPSKGTQVHTSMEVAPFEVP